MSAFWNSAGYHLVSRAENGWLDVTADYLRAYYTRPEIHPVDESCDTEHRLFDRLMSDPFAPVDTAEIAAIADPDAAENYRLVVGFRDHLVRHGTVEAAYAALFAEGAPRLPPVFLDQMAHLILRNILDRETDPMVLRAAELLFREQLVTLDEDTLMLADREIVELTAETPGAGSELVRDGGKAGRREARIDVLTAEAKEAYWERSDRFDTAIDFRFTQPAPDALAQVMRHWIRHFLGIETRILAMQSVQDKAWSWHVGLDTEATRILNALYRGEALEAGDLWQILALYRLEFEHPEVAMDSLAGKPVYLGCAMTSEQRLKLKPQNLLTNLPLRVAG